MPDDITPNVPVIHPLAENNGRDLPREPGKCNCNLCRHWFPLIETIELQLNPEGKKLLDELVGQWLSESEDLDVATAQLNGSWPDWEEMKDYTPYTHKIVKLTEEEKVARERDRKDR